MVEAGPVIPRWVDDDDYEISWWYTRDGYIFKWCLFLVPLTIIVLWYIIGRIHATRRVKKGLQPLWYHRALVPRRYRPQPPAGPPRGWPQQQPYYYHQPDGYNTYNMQPLPVYDPTRPPQYEGAPPAGTKVDPDQFMSGGQSGGNAAQVPDYQPPPGPPPPAAMR